MPKTDHLAILKRPYIDLILSGKKTVESRLTRYNRPPYRRIQPEDQIYFKCSAGPVMATATAANVWFYELLNPETVEQLRQRFDTAVCADPNYWEQKYNSRYATFIELTDIQPATAGPPIAPSRGNAWFTFAKIHTQ